MVPNSINETFEKMIIMNTKNFADAAAKNMNAMLEVISRAKPVKFSNEGVISENDFYVSIMFTGMVYGEFIFAFNSELGANLIGKTFKGQPQNKKEELNQEISEVFGEILNVTLGEAIQGLAQVYQKLTITSPRIYIGRVKYPKVRTGKSVLVTSSGEIECFLYVDQMKLDIADSYKSALISIVNANKDLRTAYEQLQEQQAQLVQAEKFAALGIMAAGVAHEINTPLSVISLNGSVMRDLVLKEIFNQENFAKILSKIESTVGKIAKITQALRIYAIDSTTTAADFKSVSINTIVETSLLFCENRLKENGVQLIKPELPESVQVECRSQQLSLALYNIILNASDAIEKIPEKWIRIEGIEKPDSIIISITDSGSGISLENQDKIFDPFFTTKDFGRGTGLGLSLSKGIVDIHKGEILLDNKSKNTRFTIEIPKLRNQNKKAA